MNNLVLMLPITLNLTSANVLHSNESIDNNNKTVIHNDYSHNKVWSLGDRKIAYSLHETNRLQ